jgi:hypothetical protein
MEKHKNGSINDIIERWTGIKFRFKSRKLTVIAVYHPPEGSGVKSKTNLIGQQTRCYIEKAKKETQITRKFISKKSERTL